MHSHSPFMVAEMSANHLGSFDRARQIVLAAAESGADAIKFQVWKPDTMCIDPSQTTTWAGRIVSLVELYRKAHTPWRWLPDLFSHARFLGIIPFAAAFDRESVDFLETLGVDRHKVASFELIDLPLIRYMASKGKPMILSTGMATRAEIDAAQYACMRARNYDLTILKCTSAYPADASDANLATLYELGDHPNGEGNASEEFKIGISDHSMGCGVAVAATVLKASMIEKHLTLSRADGGPDASFSMEPAEFKQMVTECRRAATAIGVPSYGPGPNESTALRRSLWVAKDIAEGEQLRLGDNVVIARPALGIHPDSLIEGCRARHALKAGTPLTAKGVVP